jgi:ubiquinol-cytochrome c reductase iron-sulfur subunit
MRTESMLEGMSLTSLEDIRSRIAEIWRSDNIATAKYAEFKLTSIGKNLIVKWRGKPVFIRHRTADEIDEANQVDVKSLRDPQTDDERIQRPEWLVLSLPPLLLFIIMQGRS